jgi:hypothetical protein
MTFETGCRSPLNINFLITFLRSLLHSYRISGLTILQLELQFLLFIQKTVRCHDQRKGPVAHIGAAVDIVGPLRQGIGRTGVEDEIGRRQAHFPREFKAHVARHIVGNKVDAGIGVDFNVERDALAKFVAAGDVFGNDLVRGTVPKRKALDDTKDDVFVTQGKPGGIQYPLTGRGHLIAGDQGI